MRESQSVEHGIMGGFEDVINPQTICISTTKGLAKKANSLTHPESKIFGLKAIHVSSMSSNA